MRILTVLIAGLALMTAACGGRPATQAPSGAAAQPAAGMAAVDPIDHWAGVVEKQGIKR
jgi:hypothetical protein